MKADIWKLQDAKARFSELVRRARAGRPQQVTVHGQDAVVIVDPTRFDVQPKPPREETMAGFVERSRKYRGEDIEFESRTEMAFRDRGRSLFDEDAT